MNSKSINENHPMNLVVSTREGQLISSQQNEDPIAGLTATNSGPTPFGQAVWFYATIDAGTNVHYEWDCGDGHVAHGSSIRHIYTEPGEYLATVIARNGVSEMHATTFAVVDYHTI